MTVFDTARTTFSLTFWAAGRAIHCGTNAYQAGRRIYRYEIASGALSRDLLASADSCQESIDNTLAAADRFLDDWQDFSDDLRAILVAILLPLAALLWGAAFDLAMAAARILGRVWGTWMAQSRYDLPLALLTGRRWLAVNVRSWLRVLGASTRSFVQGGLEVSDRFLSLAFCLS